MEGSRGGEEAKFCRVCRRCKPVGTFMTNGRLYKTCAECRGKNTHHYSTSLTNLSHRLGLAVANAVLQSRPSNTKSHNERFKPSSLSRSSSTLPPSPPPLAPSQQMRHTLRLDDYEQFDKLVQGAGTTRVVLLDGVDWPRSWEAFVEKYGDETGKIVVYKEIDEDRWMLATGEEPKFARIKRATVSPDGGARFTVHAWSEWYTNFLRTLAWQKEAYYLVDVNIPSAKALWSRIGELNPLLSLCDDRTSPVSLHSYLHTYNSHISIPPMDAPFYIAPVLPGKKIIIETASHEDGMGSQTAFHYCMLGDGCNRVHIHYPPHERLGKRKSEQQVERLYRRLRIPDTPTLPHDLDNYTFSVHREAWTKANEEEQLLRDFFFKGVIVLPGETLLLPAGYPHLFSKVVSFFFLSADLVLLLAILF